MTGFFPDKPGLAETEANAAKAATLFFDIDLKEVILENQQFVDKAATWFDENWGTSKYTFGVAQDAATTKKVERFLWQSDEEDIKAWVTPYVLKFLDVMDSILGKPSMILYSGHGAHIHYNLCDEDGWADEYAKKYKSHGARANYAQVKLLQEQLIAHVNKQDGNSFQFEGVTFRLVDAAAKGVSARKCSEISFINKKCYLKMKSIEPMMVDRWEAGRRIDTTKIQFELAPTIAQRVDAAAQNPGNTTAAGTAKGKISPRRVSSEYKLICRGADGNAVESCASAVMKALKEKDESLFKLEEDSGNVVGRVKIKCRPVEDNPLSHTNQPTVQDCHGWAYLDAAGSLVVRVSVSNIGKYTAGEHWKQIAGGHYVGTWVYDGIEIDLIRDPKTNAVLDNTTNYISIFGSDPFLFGKVRLNSRIMTIFVHRDIHVQTTRDEDELDKARTTVWFPIKGNHVTVFTQYLERKYGIRSAKKDFIRDALSFVASNNSYDPVRDLIRNTAWDGVDRLGDAGGKSWLCEILDLPVNHDNYPLYEGYGISTALSIVRSIFCVEESADIQHLLCLPGPQGAGKSRFPQVLGLTHIFGKDYYHDAGIKMTPGDKDTLMTLEGRFIVELPESLSLQSSTNDAQIKAFITAQATAFRRPYDKEMSMLYKNTFFVTNSNEEAFLTDATGSRRFHIVDLFRDSYFKPARGRFRIDNMWLEENILQIYAQAYNRVCLGIGIPETAETRVWRGKKVQYWNLASNLEDARDALNEQFMVSNRMAEAVEDTIKYLEGVKLFVVDFERFKNTLLARHPDLTQFKVKNSAKKYLKRFGWEVKHTSKGNLWKRIDTEEQRSPEDVAEGANQYAESVKESLSRVTPGASVDLAAPVKGSKKKVEESSEIKIEDIRMTMAQVTERTRRRRESIAAGATPVEVKKATSADSGVQENQKLSGDQDLAAKLQARLAAMRAGH